MGLILIILVVLFCFGGLPQVSGHNMGYAPTGIGTILLIVLVVLLLTGRL